jgi:hypothetical protein
LDYRAEGKVKQRQTSGANLPRLAGHTDVGNSEQSTALTKGLQCWHAGRCGANMNG